METISTKSCANCGSEAPGQYCPACGQDQGPLVLTVRQWTRDALNELFFVEQRLLKTLRLLFFSPGRLTEEWLRGRRARYVAPLRLYLFAAALLFLGWRFFSRGEAMFFVNLLPPRFFQASPGGMGVDPVAFETAVITGLKTGLLAFSVPLLAWQNKGGWGPRGSSLIVQLVFSLHLHAFGLVYILLCGVLLTLVDAPPQFAVLYLLVVPYAFLAARRVFSTSWIHAITRLVLLSLTYLTSVVIALGIYAVRHATDGAYGVGIGEVLLILFVLLVLFGARRLPEFGPRFSRH